VSFFIVHERLPRNDFIWYSRLEPGSTCEGASAPRRTAKELAEQIRKLGPAPPAPARAEIKPAKIK